MIGGQDYETISQEFYLEVDDQEISANLSDFEEITFSEPAQIKVKVSGIETVGTLVLKYEDSDGYHTGRGWFLVMDVADTDMAIALKKPICTLRKIPD